MAVNVGGERLVLDVVRGRNQVHPFFDVRWRIPAVRGGRALHAVRADVAPGDQHGPLAQLSADGPAERERRGAPVRDARRDGAGLVTVPARRGGGQRALDVGANHD